MDFDTLALSRGLHVLAVVFWIGGVAMVTTVLLPAIRKMKQPEERVMFFENIERRFALQARATTLLTGLSGFYMLYQMDGWALFSTPGYWWLHAMTGVWALFSLILFVLEPLFLHKLFHKQAQKNPDRTFHIIQIMHWVLLTLSLITIAGAVLGSHGLLFFST